MNDDDITAKPAERPPIISDVPWRAPDLVITCSCGAMEPAPLDVVVGEIVLCAYCGEPVQVLA